MNNAMPHPEPQKSLLKTIVHLGNANFGVPWTTNGPVVDFSLLTNFPNLMVNGSGHSHTLQFEKLKQRHQLTPLWQIPDESIFTGDEILVSFMKSAPLHREIDDRPEPKQETSPMRFCMVNGAFSMGCHDMPEDAFVYEEHKDIDMAVKVTEKKRRVPRNRHIVRA